jgi:hypothetical protein
VSIGDQPGRKTPCGAPNTLMSRTILAVLVLIPTLSLPALAANGGTLRLDKAGAGPYLVSL